MADAASAEAALMGEVLIGLAPPSGLKGFRVLGFRVLGFRVLGFRVLGFRV